MASANKVDATSPTGIAQLQTAPYRPKTRPMHSGSKRSCMSAICGALYSGLETPIANVSPRNTTSAEGGTRPPASVPAPKRPMASVHESARFLRPPVAPIQPLAAIMPTENAISAIADCVVVPPKWSNTMSGNSADMGENRTEKAKPIQSMANRP